MRYRQCGHCKTVFGDGMVRVAPEDVPENAEFLTVGIMCCKHCPEEHAAKFRSSEPVKYVVDGNVTAGRPGRTTMP